MSATILRWAPVAVLAVGLLLTGSSSTARAIPLRAPLASSLPSAIGEFQGSDLTISAAEQRVAGMSDYLMRSYERPGSNGAGAFSLYVGYYESQTQGKTIHSPKNCLPGAGWEALTSREVTIATALGSIAVNRYLLQQGENRALVLYWYQGRGRVAANEYAVKWHLLRDSALRGRSDEALVRVIVPVEASEDEAFRLAAEVAREAVLGVAKALPS